MLQHRRDQRLPKIFFALSLTTSQSYRHIIVEDQRLNNILNVFMVTKLVDFTENIHDNAKKNHYLFTFENVVHDKNIGLQIPKKDSFVRNYDLKSIVKYDSIRPGRKTHDPTENDIKLIKYSLDGTIQMKLNFDDEYMDLLHRISRNEVGNLCYFPQFKTNQLK
ncbi:hypothetical protein PR048_023493 [Dryococelus australis]|uniref:Uncharacterized protein n=1 Tax=Dryococelus australis TaxID=614101 RepID=A0ABQ9GU85_9NEOP|nr:hypothetical protein PR048_023493 [Dryococelus australis]